MSTFGGSGSNPSDAPRRRSATVLATALYVLAGCVGVGTLVLTIWSIKAAGGHIYSGTLVGVFLGEALAAWIVRTADRVGEEERERDVAHPLRCPACGEERLAGSVSCSSCGYDAGQESGQHQVKEQPSLNGN